MTQECEIVSVFQDRVKHHPQGFVSANGLQMSFDSFGSKEDPALILIMGLGMQYVHWDDNFCKLLASKGFYVIRFDNRDIGHSPFMNYLPKPNVWDLIKHAFLGREYTPPYTLEDMAKDTLELMNGLGVSRAHIVGASMGGMIGQLLALRAPHRVASLTNIMTSAGDLAIHKPRFGLLRLCLRKIPMDEEGFLTMSLNLWRLINGPKYKVDEQRISRIIMTARRRGHNTDGIIRQFAAIVTAKDRFALLTRLSIPSLVIHGDADPLIPVSCGKRLAQAIPDTRCVIYPGMGHTLPPQLWPDITSQIAQVAKRPNQF